MILDNISSPDDVKKLNDSEKKVLAEEVRAFLIDNVSKTGGHLAANLGVVELTIALHSVFDPYKDKIVWDVGHQSYVHKIFTGRKDKFPTLRQLGGLSGFPKSEESCADVFNTGHSSTSISAALGFSAANKIKGEDNYAVAMIGDGALTGGMAFEALNHAGSREMPLIVVLNDNGMSISKNVGGLAKRLRKIRNHPKYFKLKSDVKNALDKIPVIGDPVKRRIMKTKKNLKKLILQNVVFEDLGFTYLGPVDGHNISDLTVVLEQAKSLKEPVLIHVQTIKGKGYLPAEKSPGEYHGVKTFDPETGRPLNKAGGESWSQLFGGEICAIGDENKDVVCVTAAMPEGTGLRDFALKFPNRFFDVGIAEQHAVTFCAAMAKSGLIPVFAVYSTFLQRGYDQVLHDVALQNLHVVFCIDRSGPVGADGETHQGIFDISYLSHIPNITVLSPACANDFKTMLRYAINECMGPVALRYPKGLAEYDGSLGVYNGCDMLIENGNRGIIAAVGTMAKKALEVSEILKNRGADVAVIAVKCVKPIDKLTVDMGIKTSGFVVTIENNAVIGGYGEMLEDKIKKPILKFGYPDEPIPQGKVSELEDIYGLTSEKIADKIIKEFNL